MGLVIRNAAEGVGTAIGIAVIVLIVLAASWGLCALAFWLVAPTFGWVWSAKCVTGIWLFILMLSDSSSTTN